MSEDITYGIVRVSNGGTWVTIERTPKPVTINEHTASDVVEGLKQQVGKQVLVFGQMSYQSGGGDTRAFIEAKGFQRSAFLF